MSSEVLCIKRGRAPNNLGMEQRANEEMPGPIQEARLDKPG